MSTLPRQPARHQQLTRSAAATGRVFLGNIRFAMGALNRILGHVSSAIRATDRIGFEVPIGIIGVGKLPLFKVGFVIVVRIVGPCHHVEETVSLLWPSVSSLAGQFTGACANIRAIAGNEGGTGIPACLESEAGIFACLEGGAGIFACHRIREWGTFLSSRTNSNPLGGQECPRSRIRDRQECLPHLIPGDIVSNRCPKILARPSAIRQCLTLHFSE